MQCSPDKFKPYEMYNVAMSSGCKDVTHMATLILEIEGLGGKLC